MVWREARRPHRAGPIIRDGASHPWPRRAAVEHRLLLLLLGLQGRVLRGRWAVVHRQRRLEQRRGQQHGRPLPVVHHEGEGCEQAEEEGKEGEEGGGQAKPLLLPLLSLLRVHLPPPLEAGARG